MRVEQFQGLFAGFCGGDNVDALQLEQDARRVTKGGVVVDQHDPHGHIFTLDRRADRCHEW